MEMETRRLQRRRRPENHSSLHVKQASNSFSGWLASPYSCLLSISCLLLLCESAAAASSGGIHSNSVHEVITAPFDDFPKLEDVSEMGNLSDAVYKYHRWNTEKQGDVCDDWNNVTSATLTTLGTRKAAPGDAKCHWYRHDKVLGTQVMIVTSQHRDYVSIVFAGTDDLKTSLLDVDVRKTDFGTSDLKETNRFLHQVDSPWNHHDKKKNSSKDSNVTNIPVALHGCPDCKVHSGFNNAVFANNIFDDVYSRVEQLRPHYSRLFTTGHSLGAANAIFTALALAIQFEEKHIVPPILEDSEGVSKAIMMRSQRKKKKKKKKEEAFPIITSINFGCPQLGNVAFRDFVNARYLTHSNKTHHNPSLAIWRFVMGWDLVPRLPDFFEHIGHTVEMNQDECPFNTAVDSDDCAYYHKWWFHKHNRTEEQGLAYYHHIGNDTLRYAGVPTGWSAKPYVWVPGALLSHAISKYAAFINEWRQWSSRTWIQDFVSLDDDTKNTSSLVDDDDTYSEPPDDDAADMLVTALKEADSRGVDHIEESYWRSLKKKLGWY